MGCRIHRLLLYRGVRPPNECPGYDTKQSDGEVPVMLKLWEMWSTPSLSLLPGLLWPGMVAFDRALSMRWIELNCILMLNWIVWIRTVGLNWIAWNRNVFHNETVYLNLNWVLMLKWIIWNGTVFDIETVLTELFNGTVHFYSIGWLVGWLLVFMAYQPFLIIPGQILFSHIKYIRFVTLFLNELEPIC